MTTPILNEHVGIDGNAKLLTVTSAQVLVENTLPLLRSNLEKMQELIPCKQFQIALMDVESLETHHKSFIQEGPLTPFYDRPLEETEIRDIEQIKEQVEFIQKGGIGPTEAKMLDAIRERLTPEEVAEVFPNYKQPEAL